jgi:hypothetical protein
MNPQQKQTLFDNTARQVDQAARHIQEWHIANCAMADPAYGECPHRRIRNARDRWPGAAMAVGMGGRRRRGNSGHRKLVRKGRVSLDRVRPPAGVAKVLGIKPQMVAAE